MKVPPSDHVIAMPTKPHLVQLLAMASVLFVEDEPTIAIPLIDELEEHGCRVRHTSDGDEAVRLTAQIAFDVLITDLRLPGADGVQVVRAARLQRPEARILVITASTSRELEAVLADGVGSILKKPFFNGAVLDWLRSGIPA